jgi:glutathione S-transferase
MPTLYTTPLSANGRKVLAVVRHLRVDARIELVDVYRGEGRTPAYLAINPQGKIPTLVEGDFVLWESNAIIQYLDEAYGDFALSSREPRRRADVARWLFWEAAHWQPAFVPVLAAFVGHHVLPEGARPPATVVSWDDAMLRERLAFLETHLAGRHFLVGDDPTLADFSVAGMMTYARAASFPFGEFPHIAAWYGRIEALDAWKATAAGPWA